MGNKAWFHWQYVINCFIIGCCAVSHLYGFGLMDAEAMVKEAETWKQVPSQHVCEENIVQTAR